LGQTHPDYHPARFNQGYALVQMKDYERARPLLESYLALKPDDAMALGVLAVLEIAEKRYEQALVLLDRAIVINPQWSVPYMDAATVSATMEQAARALSYLERALEFTAPAEVYHLYQTQPFQSIRATDEGKRLESLIAQRARQGMK
jgi:tetratricopeptide (TPR) repeat protein